MTRRVRPRMSSPALPFVAAALAAAAWAAPLAAQGGAEHPRDLAVRAVERTTPVALDGRLDEEVWASAPAASGFTQQEPHEGRPATQRTEVRFAYDAEALYVGARMYDSLGAEGVRTRLVRRDQAVESDWLLLVFDTFHDHSGRTEFQVNPSGVKYDAGQATPSADPSWDPVWEAATRVDSLGWTAELRIPFSQLRFSRDVEQTWGMQVWRHAQRLNETSMWSFWGKNDAGGPARFGHLEGIRVERRPQGLEILPYTVARASYVAPTQPGSPFQDARAYDARVGADVKALLGSSVTLSATLNPDFGQVEVDPATVNLSAFETFFEERRPFFTEAGQLLAGTGPAFFYSRRIGASPREDVVNNLLLASGPVQGYDYWDVPNTSTILGAAKLSGRLSSGTSVGALAAVTDREYLRTFFLDSLGGENFGRLEVAPRSAFTVLRGQQEFGPFGSTAGLSFTGMRRDLGDGSPLA
ncbi:MAG TPA: DUF5916 domain-containing protein, partial [Longimicrobiaceae bacterium]|nr:DUF5916 domain-containing protein [Longimicrobiaceae bacterium]